MPAGRLSPPPPVLPHLRRARAVAPLLAIATSACLAGPATAIGGGPIGRAPNLREAELLPVPDSTRGVGFILSSNRRDLLEETRVELNAGARAFERIFGSRPDEADVRLTSDQREVRVTLRVGRRQVAPFTVSLQRDDRGRPRIPESMHIASAVVLATAREWLTTLVHDLVPSDTSSAGWMQRDGVPVWLRLGLLQGAAVSPVHDRWLVQLARERDSLPTVAALMRPDSCDAECLAPFTRAGDAAPGSADVPLTSRRGRLPALDGRVRYAASTYSLVQFIAKREGPEYMRALVTTALTGGDFTAALGSARSFTADPGDIDRQWRVWLAPFAFPEGQ